MTVYKKKHGMREPWQSPVGAGVLTFEILGWQCAFFFFFFFLHACHFETATLGSGRLSVDRTVALDPGAVTRQTCLVSSVRLGPPMSRVVFDSISVNIYTWTVGERSDKIVQH